ncbi:hypothetical protein Tco_0345211 [Tanacetum coccineum]
MDSKNDAEIQGRTSAIRDTLDQEEPTEPSGSSADGSSKNYKIFSEMLDDFDRQDVIGLPDWYKKVDETEDETEDDPNPTPTSRKTSRGPRMKSKAKKTKEKEAQVKAKKRARIVWSQEEELILAESFIQISEDPRVGSDQKNDTFWYKILEAYNAEAKKRGYMERTKNMLTGKWTSMNANVQKFNQIVGETLVHNKYKWKNLESTLARRNHLRVTDEDPEHFGDDALPRPLGLQRIAKSQRSGSNSIASSGSNPMMYQEFMKEQYELDRKTKIEVIERETNERMRSYHSQRITEDMKVLQIDTRGMDPDNAAIINAQMA